MNKTFSLVEHFVILFIISVIVAMMVPNFLESEKQVKEKLKKIEEKKEAQMNGSF